MRVLVCVLVLSIGCNPTIANSKCQLDSDCVSVAKANHCDAARCDVSNMCQCTHLPQDLSRLPGQSVDLSRPPDDLSANSSCSVTATPDLVALQGPAAVGGVGALVIAVVNNVDRSTPTATRLTIGGVPGVILFRDDSAGPALSYLWVSVAPGTPQGAQLIKASDCAGASPQTSFTFNVGAQAAPTITAVSPTSNATSNTVITVTGTSFTGATKAHFYDPKGVDTLRTPAVVSATTFTVNSPGGTPGTRSQIWIEGANASGTATSYPTLVAF